MHAALTQCVATASPIVCRTCVSNTACGPRRRGLHRDHIARRAPVLGWKRANSGSDSLRTRKMGRSATTPLAGRLIE